MIQLIAIQHVTVQNNEWSLIILCHKFRNCTQLKTAFSKNKLLIWSDHHFIFEIKSRLTHNQTSLISEMSLIQIKSMIKRESLSRVSLVRQMSSDNLLFTRINDSFWSISLKIWRFWKNSYETSIKVDKFQKCLHFFQMCEFSSFDYCSDLFRIHLDIIAIDYHCQKLRLDNVKFIFVYVCLNVCFAQTLKNLLYVLNVFFLAVVVDDDVI